MCDQKTNHATEQKKLTPLRAKNYVTHALQLELHEQMNKKKI